MDNTAQLGPSTVDGVVATVETSTKSVIVSEQSPRRPTRSSDSMARKVVVKPEVTGEPEKPSSDPKFEDWAPEPFFKDAEWFAKHCALSHVGEAPLKISDITEEMMKEYFGEKTRNGYRLTACTGIPCEYLVALSQVADGYDKPVNGVLSHTFAKGVYAEFILKREVDWASYAATKLKGQILMLRREKKPKPDGPPWIRKPTRYVNPLVKESKPVVATAAKGKKLELEVWRSSTVAEDTEVVGDESPSKLAKVSKELRTPDVSMQKTTSDAISNSAEFLSLIGNQVEKMKMRLSKLSEDRKNVEVTMAKLDSQRLGHTIAEIARLEVEIRDLNQKLQFDEDLVGETTSDMELEANKDVEGDDSDEISTNLLAMMAKKLASHEQAVLDSTSLLKKAKRTLSATGEELERKRKKHATLPRTVQKLKSVTVALEAERVKIQSCLNDLITEERNVRRTLSKPCSPLAPVYVLTSTDAYVAQVTVTSCLLCCNGYHCNNWVPASCGHTYHPVCLFTHLTTEKSKAKCLACKEPLSGDWMRSWGLDNSWRDLGESTQYQGLMNENEDVYGKDCSQLARRRQWVQNMDFLQSKDDRDEIAAVSGLQSRVPSAVTEEGNQVILVEDGSSMQQLLEPKVEGESGKKCGAPVGFADGILSSTPSSIGQASCIVEEFLALPLTPSATLPFTPETRIAFKPYTLVRTPHCSKEPTIPTRWSRRVVEHSRKKELEFSN